MWVVPALLLAPVLAVATCMEPKEELDPEFEIAERLPGLVPIHHDDFDSAFLRPRAELGSYLAVMIDPVQVEYYDSPSHQTRTPPGSTTEALAEAVKEVFVEELAADDGYPIVDEPGPGVLGVRVSLVNVELDSTSSMSGLGGAGGARVRSVGEFSVSNDEPWRAEMSIVLELYDADTDLLLFWGRDRRSSPLALRSGTRNALIGRGRNVSRYWAEVLREGLGGPPTRAQGPEEIEPLD